MGKWFKVNITSNIDKILGELANFHGVLVKLDSLRVSVWSDLEYAVYTEFGTYKMAPHAMVRLSMPNIEAYFMGEWMALPVMFSQEDLKDMMNRTINYAKDEIVRRTHEDTGALKASWQVDEME
jgi:isopentenyl diphosphate isomerase/L-lactate dehydrogenase-like FMN-dependent dehydrogenase